MQWKQKSILIYSKIYNFDNRVHVNRSFNHSFKGEATLWNFEGMVLKLFYLCVAYLVSWVSLRPGLPRVPLRQKQHTGQLVKGLSFTH